MAYATISSWDTTDWTDDMEDLARNKYVPMVMQLGASSIHMIRTGDRSFTVVTHYPDEASAQAAQDKIAAIRQEASEEMPMSMADVRAGAVFASG